MMHVHHPLMLGLVGDSGAGKTSLALGLARILGRAGVTPICLDDYHRYSRAERSTRGITAGDPAANDLELMATHLAVLRAGGSVRKPVYDHRSGTLRAPELVAATGLVIAYGMLTFTPPSLVELFDLTIYLEPADELRHSWRLGRDTRERGYAPAQVLALRGANDRDADRYVRVQRRHADLVVRFLAAPTAHAQDLPVPLAADLLLRPGPRTAALQPLLDRVAASELPGLSLARAIGDDDGGVADRLRIDAQLDQLAAAGLADQLWAALPALPALPLRQLGVLGGGESPARSDTLALAQLLIAILLASAPRERLQRDEG
jgi:phosphoribulokinase